MEIYCRITFLSLLVTGTGTSVYLWTGTNLLIWQNDISCRLL